MEERVGIGGRRTKAGKERRERGRERGREARVGPEA